MFRGVVLIVLAVAAFGEHAPANSLANVNDAVGKLSFSLLGNLYKDNENTVFSGYSIETVLGMALMGAKGKTFNALRDGLFLTGSSHEIAQAFKKSSQETTGMATSTGSGSILKQANRIYTAKAFAIGSKYNSSLQKNFNADAESVDFTAQAVVQKKINSYVAEQTNQLIPELLTSPLDASTQLLLVNALYFKGTWQKKFHLVQSNERFNSHFQFHKTDPRLKILVAISPAEAGQKATWMNAVSWYPYAANDAIVKGTIVELPYVPNSNTDGETSMVIILPDDEHKTKFDAWIKSLTWDKVKAALNSTVDTNVNLTMPKFEIDSHFDLEEILKNSSMATAFSDEANFGGIIDARSANLKINKVVHAAKIMVDEKGTLAAAATASGFIVTSTGQLEKPVELKINRSFLAMIVLKQNGIRVPLFVSSVVSTV